MNTRKNSIRNWLRKCGILTLTAGMILTGMITKPVETYAVTFVQDTDGTKYAVDKKWILLCAFQECYEKKQLQYLYVWRSENGCHFSVQMQQLYCHRCKQ